LRPSAKIRYKHLEPKTEIANGRASVRESANVSVNVNATANSSNVSEHNGSNSEIKNNRRVTASNEGRINGPFSQPPNRHLEARAPPHNRQHLWPKPHPLSSLCKLRKSFPRPVGSLLLLMAMTTRLLGVGVWRRRRQPSRSPSQRRLKSG
jgi:hypothetical protein